MTPLKFDMASYHTYIWAVKMIGIDWALTNLFDENTKVIVS